MARKRPEGAARRRLRVALPALLVGAVALAAYVPTLGHGLVWDDEFLLPYVQRVVAEGGWRGLLTAEFQVQGPLGYYRPVVLASLALDQALGGGSSTAFHLTNLLLHEACSVLVWVLSRSFLSRAGATLGGLLFALHPVHTEAVAFVSARTDLWAAFFCLLAAVLWSRPRTSSGRGAVLWRAIASAAAFLLATLSKEHAFALPAVLLAWDGLRGSAGGPAGWWRRNRVWLAAWGGAAVAALALRLGVAGIPLGTGGAGGFFHQDPGLVPSLWIAYVRLLVVPWPLRAHYSAAELAPSPLDLALAAGAALLLLSLASKRHGRLGLVAGVWAAGFLLPVAGLVPLAGVLLAERYLYLPSVAASLVVGYVCADLPLAARAKLALRLAGVALPLVALVATLARLPVWADDSALYQSMVRDSPGSALGHFNLANLYLEEGRLPEALRLYSEAVRLDPEYVRALTNRAGVLSLLGRHREALADVERAIALDPGHANAHHQLGRALGGLNHWHRAAAALGRAVELRPDDIGARLNLAIALANTGRTREAERILREILREHPDQLRAQTLLARLRAASGTS